MLPIVDTSAHSITQAGQSHRTDTFNPGLGADPEATEVCGMTVPTKEEIWQTVKSSPGKAWATASEHLPDLPPIDWQAYQPSWPAIDWKFWD